MTAGELRATLVLPAGDERKLRSGLSKRCDALLLDLEDAVPEGAKTAAREAVCEQLAEIDDPRPIGVRINGVQSLLHVDDVTELARAIPDRVQYIVIPKVESAFDVMHVNRIVESVWQSVGSSTRPVLHALVESVTGVLDARAIASAVPHLQALVFGPGDLAASQHARPERAPDQAFAHNMWHPARSQVLLAARSAGIMAIDGPEAMIDVTDEFSIDVARSAALGFDGKWAIHPNQLPEILHQFSPSSQDVAYAKRVVAAYESSVRRGAGALSVDGKLVDAASLRHANRVVALGDARDNEGTIQDGAN